MTTLLTGTLERTVGWFHPRGHLEPELPFRLRVAPFASAHPATQSTVVQAPAQRAVSLDLRLRQWFCAASRGHGFIKGIDGPRMYLICQHCFHETAGWEVSGRQPRVRD